MKKIMFNDKFGLTKAVLEGRKTMTRRMIIQPPYENFDVAFPAPDVAFEEKHPLCGAFCWVNKDNPEEHTDWIRLLYKIGEEVAIAQNYKDVLSSEHLSKEQEQEVCRLVEAEHKGCSNKMFVKAELMPHRIRITNVSLQKLQDISDEDCLKEGIVKWTKDGKVFKYDLDDRFEIFRWSEMPKDPKKTFSVLIDAIAGKGTWEKNPYVFVYEFELIK